MMFDLNAEQEQQLRPSGPIPVGSSVLVKLSLRTPRIPEGNMDGVGVTKSSGLLYLDAEYEVQHGTYQGLKIWEFLFLPVGQQTVSLTEGQNQACRIAGAKMKAMLNAAHNIMPKDDSPSAKRKRQFSSWLEFDGLVFPVSVGIKNEPSEGKDGRTYWNNTISRVITPDAKEYDSIMHGGEHITDGPTSGTGRKTGTKENAAHRDGYSSDPGFEAPPADAYDDVPF